MKLPILFSAFLLIALSACSVSSKEGVMETETRAGGFMGLSTKDDIEVATPKAFAEKQRVVIGSFKVGFNESKSLQKKAGGGLLGGGFGGKSTGLVKLEGISAGTLQQITDQAYTDFVSELKSKGYTIVPRSELVNSEHFDGVKTYDFPYVDDDSGIFSEYGVGTYYSPSAIGNKQPIFVGEVPGVTGGFGFANPASAAAEYGKATGVSVLNVSYFVDFAGASGSGGRWTTTSSVQVGQLLSVDRGVLGITSDWGGTFSTGVGSLTLGQPIGSQVEFARIENVSSDTDVGIETATNVVSAVLGGGTNQTREFIYHADAGKYKQASMEVLKKANDNFVGKMAQLR